jgi:transcription antitermination factor NusG
LHCHSWLWFFKTESGFWFTPKTELRCKPSPLPEPNPFPSPPRSGPYLKAGDAVTICDGPFEAFEGEVIDADYSAGKVTVRVLVFDQWTPVELESWQFKMS